jgi:hypothetical protein
MDLPCRWADGGLCDFSGRVRFTRRFGRPRQIDAHERVWLTIAAADGIISVRLNGRLIGPPTTDGSFEAPVTHLLEARNLLTVEVAAGPDGGLVGEVVLEVRCAAYLKDVRGHITGEPGAVAVHVEGLVIGEADRPLDLYMLLDGATAAYTSIAADPAGRPFVLTSEPRPAAPREARVELVNGASLWHAEEVLIAGHSPELAPGH